MNGLVYCHNCHSRCTPKTSQKGKYQYFGCRYAGAGCSNHGNAVKSEIEEKLCQELTQASQLMRRETMDARNTLTGLKYAVLSAQNASPEVLTEFASNTQPQYKYWKDPTGWQVNSKLDKLRQDREELNGIRSSHYSIEEAKRQLDKEIAEEERRERSHLNKTAAEVIFNGNNLVFWQTLSNDDKVSIYSKVVDRIYIQDGEVAQINLRTEPEGDVEALWTMSSQFSNATVNASS